MFDKEIEAIAKCTELLKELDDSSRVRVLKYLIERFEIGVTPKHASTFVPNLQLNQPTQNDIIIQPEYVTTDNDSGDYPTLKQLLVKNLPKNETEWILCYAFFASNYGNDTFKRDQILEKYKESNRSSKGNIANLNNNLNSCIKKDWFKDTNKDEFIVKPEGITYAKEVLKGNSTTKEVKRVKRGKTNTEITVE